MKQFKNWIVSLAAVLMVLPAFANINPKQAQPTGNNPQFSFRGEPCVTTKKDINLAVNNVRARLQVGGDIWWDRNDGKYIVPAVGPGEVEVSSIFAGAVWLGGFDEGNNLKVAAQTYGANSGRTDFFAGPLSVADGTTENEQCLQWDRFWVVTGDEVDEHLKRYSDFVNKGIPYDASEIPDGVKGYPGRGNEFFFEINEFELPETDQGLGSFFDRNDNNLYEPLDGDHPIIDIRGCEEFPVQYADEMIFWIYNDAGAIHSQYMGAQIQMEIQVQAFAYATNDDINNMSFMRYKLINRATSDIKDMYFAMWVDADLGCYLDDYIGCNIDTIAGKSRSLAYYYNADAVDGQPGTQCAGVPTYGNNVPMVGIDYFRGPLDENGGELGMSSFTYFNNPAFNSPPTSTTDPDNAQEVYYYMSGFWKDGTPFTDGGSGYNPAGVPSKYVFPASPHTDGGWSMCEEALPQYDRRTVQASGPFILKPGAVNELIVGAVWVPDVQYPCPNISRILQADDLAQNLFDNCFDLADGPDAPTVDWVELDEELVAVLSYEGRNFEFDYKEKNLLATIDSQFYSFEGYQIYQLAGIDVTITPDNLADPTKARLVALVDVKNNVKELYNWTTIPNADTAFTAAEFLYFPNLMNEGAKNEGLEHTFVINADQFGAENRRLINHKKYFFTVLAYGQNNYEIFDPRDQSGSVTPFLQGRKNIRTYTVIPRPTTDRNLNARYGDGPIVTRFDGVGTGGNFLDMSTETRDKIMDGTFDESIVYNPGGSPLNIKVYNPLELLDGEFELKFVDPATGGNNNNNTLDTELYWSLTNLSDPSAPILSDTSILFLNEQILKEYGFTLTIGQVDEVGSETRGRNGAAGATITYGDPDGIPWFSGIPDGGGALSAITPIAGLIFDFAANGSGEGCELSDIDQSLTSMGDGYFFPFQLAKFGQDPNAILPYLTPGWKANGNLVHCDAAELATLNNVDIILTSDKSKWSRCVIVETAVADYTALGLSTEGSRVQFDLRASPSVGKDDNNGDGLPDPDGEKIGTRDLQGMGWFPGYAIDVETGRRLNIFFGENSVYDCSLFCENYADGIATGRDMMFNPSSQVEIQTGGQSNIFNAYAGGQHYIYVTDETYDECALIRPRIDPSESGFNQLRKVQALKKITWCGVPLLAQGTSLRSYANGLIPNETTIKLRVDNPYQVAKGTNENQGTNLYRFKFEGKQPTALAQEQLSTALDAINVVPNPYYGFSQYESNQFDNIVKITNLPKKCTVTIMTLDGKFVRRYDRDEIGSDNNEDGIFSGFGSDIEWDLKNGRFIPVSSGVYLIHVAAPGVGERTLKWFGVQRQFDPTGL